MLFRSILKGQDGITHRQKVMNKYLNIIDKPAVDGCDIITTIDVDMQDIAEKALVDQLKNLEAVFGVVPHCGTVIQSGYQNRILWQ